MSPAFSKVPHVLGLSVVSGLILGAVHLAYGRACAVGLVVGVVVGVAGAITAAHIAVDRFAAGPRR